MRAIQQRQAKSKGLQSIKHGSITGVDVAKHRLYTCNSLLHKCHIAQNVRLFCTDGTEFSIGRPTILDTLFGSDKKRLLKNDGNTDQHNRLFACKLLSQDPQLPIDDSLLYDKVIVDAECTHDGSIVHVLKRTQSADDKFSLNLRDLDQLELLQRRLLERGFKSLKPGGTLVYSTCSFAARQNEGIILWFMQKYGGEAELSKVPGLESIDQSGGETQKSINAYLDKQFYSKFHSETDKRLLIDIKQSTVRFYGDYAKCRVTGEQFWTSGFFVAKIVKRLR